MKAILIDPITRTITEVEHLGGIKDTYKFLECRLYDVVCLGFKEKQENDIYVDDEGINGDMKGGFKYDGKPLAGKGLVIGCNTNNGKSIATNLTIEEVTNKVSWLTKEDCERIFAEYM